MDNLLYSKRKKMIAQVNQPEVYQYDRLPIKFRRQVVHIWMSTISVYQSLLNSDYWGFIYKHLLRELGLFQLGSDWQARPCDQCFDFLLDEKTPIDNILDLIELTFQCIEGFRETMLVRGINQSSLNQIEAQSPNSAIKELNARFREHGIGYQYNNGQIMRVDSGFIHAEVVIPALTLLSSQDFSGAEQEFRIAHKDYREQKYKEAIANASKAFESTIKTICTRLDWDYEENDTASILIERILKKELIPKYNGQHLHGLKSILVSVSTPRNKEAGHGQGENVKQVPEYLAGYVLHITASNIVFLVEAYKSHQASFK
jgi:AbiJ N-terminal domain 4